MNSFGLACREMQFFFDVCGEMVVVKELLDVSAGWDEVKALYILELSA